MIHRPLRVGVAVDNTVAVVIRFTAKTTTRPFDLLSSETKRFLEMVNYEFAPTAFFGIDEVVPQIG